MGSLQSQVSRLRSLVHRLLNVVMMGRSVVHLPKIKVTLLKRNVSLFVVVGDQASALVLEGAIVVLEIPVELVIVLLPHRLRSQVWLRLNQASPHYL